MAACRETEKTGCSAGHGVGGQECALRLSYIVASLQNMTPLLLAAPYQAGPLPSPSRDRWRGQVCRNALAASTGPQTRFCNPHQGPKLGAMHAGPAQGWRRHQEGTERDAELRNTGCFYNCFPICSVAPATSNGPVWSWQGSFGLSKQVSLMGHITPLLEGCGAAIRSHGMALLTAVC